MAVRAEFATEKSLLWLKILLVLFLSCHDKLGYLRAVIAAKQHTWSFDDLSKNMVKHGAARNSKSPVSDGLYLDGSNGTYVKLNGHNKSCMKDPSDCDITIGFFFKYRYENHTDSEIFFGNKDDNDINYKGVNIIYKNGRTHVVVYGRDRYCNYTIQVRYGVWGYLGLIWEKTGNLTVYRDGWVDYAFRHQRCGSSPSGLTTRDNYYLGRETFPIAYYKDLNIWYSKQNKTVLDTKWRAAFGNGGMTQLTLKIIFSDLAYNASKVDPWKANFTATVQELFSGDSKFKKIKNVSISNSGGNASVSFKLTFTRVQWPSILTLQLALENGSFFGSHGTFDEAGCISDDNFFCQVPKKHAARVIRHNSIAIRMDPVIEDEDENYLYGYRVLYKNLDDPNSEWAAKLHRRNPPGSNGVWIPLQPYTNYSFRVVAISFKSAGLVSEAIQAKTKEWVPSIGPDIVANNSTNSTTIYVQWNHTIPPDKVPGILIGYRVYWDEDVYPRGDSHGFKNVGLNATNYTITGLYEHWLYKVWVAGRTSAGPGKYTKRTVMTLDDVPSASPASIHLIMVNSSSLEASWEQVPLLHRNGIILGYRVQLQQTDSGQVVWNRTVGSNVYPFNFTGLMVFQNYSVQVAAFSRKGEGPLSNKVYQMTDGSVPINSPDSLAAYNVSSSVIEVNWNYHEEPRLTLGHLQGFTLFLREANASDVFTADGRLLTKNRSLVNGTQITGLKIFRLYNISIAARTNKGVGPTNQSVIVRTDGEAPGAPPQSLAAHDTSNSSLYAYWEEVVLDKHHGIMQGYKVSIYELTKQGFESLENRTDQLSVLEAYFTGLNVFTKYMIEVLGFNNFGDGPSKSVEVFTEESYPTRPPSNFTAVQKSSTRLRAVWNEVPECCRRGIILGYHVTLIDPSSVSITETVTNSDLFRNFNNLKKFHVYNLTVEAFTSKGVGPKAFTSATTDQDVPEAPPQNVIGYNISQSEILVSWRPVPKDKINGIVTEYDISYREVGRNYSRHKAFNSSASQGVVDGLKPFTMYSFNVSASTIKGYGPFSAAIHVKTEEEAPQVTPSKFKGFNSSSTSIKLSWNPIPQSQVAGVLRKFHITYRELNTDDNSTHTIAVPITNLSFELTSLRKYTSYRLEIKGATKFLGRPTAPIVITTDEDVPSLPPEDIKIQNSSATSLSVQWNPIPKDSVHGILRGIKLQYRAATRDNSIVFRFRARRAVEKGWSKYKTITLPPNMSSFELTSLKNFTNYSIVIFGFTSKGDGNVSQQFVVSTDENIPSKPPTAFVPRSRSGDFEMDVTWGPVPDGYVHGILLGYRIYFTKTRELGYAISAPTRAITVGPNVYNKTITLLSNFATYNLEITAFTIKGEGSRSIIKEGSTCNCPRLFRTSWYDFPPYISYDNGTVGGFIPQIFDIALQACCIDCILPNGRSASKINYEFDGKGGPGRKTSVEDLITGIDSDTDFIVPINGYEGQTHYSLYRYVKLAESPGVAFITVMDSAEKAVAIANVFLHSWPLLLMSSLMMVVAGIVMWSLDTRPNTDEFPTSFLRGTYEGMWWAFVTSTTVGYGDRCPKGMVSRLVAIVWTLCGLVVIAILTGTIATALTEFGYSGPYITLYGTQVAAISNSSEFRLGIRKNARVNTVRSYNTYEEIRQALANQEVKGALVDLYVLSSHKHLFEDPRFRIVRVYDYKTSYGVVLAGNSMKLSECFTEQIKSDAAHVFESIEENVKILKEPEDSPAEQQSTELFSATSPKFLTAVIIIATLLVLASAMGIIYEFRRDNTREVLMQSKDLRNELQPIVDTFVANMKKKIKVFSKRHRRQQCHIIRAEKESNQQAAMVFNQYYEFLSSRDIRQDWSPKLNSVQRASSDPTVWPFSSIDTNNLTVPSITRTLASPFNRGKKKQGSYNLSEPFTLEPTVRVIEETRL